MSMMLGRLAVASSVLVSVAAANEQQCGLYLAISSTSTVEETNWGLYAGKDIPIDTIVGSPDVGINIPHLRANNEVPQEDGEEGQLGQIVDFFEGFFWVPDTAAAQYELSSGRAIAAIPGAGVLGSYNAKMTNADWNFTSGHFRPVLGEETGAPHPNRGAISPFYNLQVVSTSKINAGNEIFMNYGENYEEHEGKDELTREDFTRIDETVEQMIAFFEKHNDSLDKESKLEIYSFLIKDVMKAAVGKVKARRVSALLPPNPDDLHKVRDGGGALAFSNPTTYRSQEWLETYGLCMDNIRAGASTIPNAGRGAFATRKIASGTLVAPVPLTHVPDKAVLNMHELTTTDSDDYIRKSDDVTTQQLLLNYCYGHPESSMVFFPSGAVASLINHSDEPNAKLVWSKHPNHQKMWLGMDPKELLDEEYQFIGLVMEIVATKDIAPGEEILISYGLDWKAAYEKHVDAWNAKVASGEIAKEWPLHSVDMNEEYSTKPLKTEAELEKEPYPENVSLMAFLLLKDTDSAGTAEDPKEWAESGDESAFLLDNLFEAAIVDRTKVDGDGGVTYTYTVKWANKFGAKTFVAGVPHEAIVFVDKPGTSDQFTEGAFRHYIGIPDEIFPHGPWRNL